jgi:hypothetical protein
MGLKSFVKKVGKAVGGALDSVVKNPIPTLVGVIGMAYGIPPVYAGALSGATGAAMTGGNILKGAVTGGAMAYVGQQTSTYLGGQGFNPIVVGAGTGAVLGATGSVLGGGKQSMALNVLTGGIIGAATGYYVSKTGSTTYTYDDGSTLTTYRDGSTTATASNTMLAPVSDLNPPPAGLSDVLSSDQASLAPTSKYALTSTGLVNDPTADILAQNGYTPSDVSSLIQQGYTPNELINMASTGVPAETLINLSNSQFSEQSINNMLSSNVSANDISAASQLVNNGSLNVNTASQLLKSGLTTSDLNSIAYTGQANQVSYLMDKGVSFDTAKALLDNNVNLNNVNYQMETKQFSSAQLNNSINDNTYKTLLKIEPTLPPPPPTPVQTVAPVKPIEPEYVSPSIPDYAIKTKLGDQTLYYDPITGDVYNSNGTTNYAATDMASNRPESIGIQTADAKNVIKNAQPNVVSDTPYRVEVGGSAGFKDSPGNVIQEYRRPNTDLATQQQIDNGTAKYNSAANAWEVDTKPLSPVVNVPYLPNTRVSNVDLFANPATPINVPYVPIVTPPTTVAPAVNTPAVQPVAPVAPQPVTPPRPTVVSSSTRTSVDGSVTRDDQMSDGTIVSTMISGPTTGTSTSTTPTTEIPTIEVTAPRPPPLTPPVSVVIPDNSSYVAPVVVEPPAEPVAPVTPTTPTTTPPVVNVANPPIVTDQPPTKPTTYGVYSFGDPINIKLATGLNPGLIAPTPYYQTTNPAQSQYYWGSHPYQPGQTFDNELYNNAPGAPATPYGLGYAQKQATAEQIMAKMQGLYPNYGTRTVTGPAIP